MPEKQVTIHYSDDGTVDIAKFADDPHLSRVKQLVDGLRGSVDDLKTKAARISDVEKLGTPEQIATWKKAAEEELPALRDQIAGLEGKVGMTDEEKQELENLRQRAKDLEKFDGLDPDAARKAIEFQQRTEKERELSKAFKIAGMNPEAALRLEGVRSLETRVQTEQRDGKPVEVAQVKVGEEWRPLNQHVESEYSDFLGVLKPDAKPNGKTPVDGVRGSGNPKGQPSTLREAISQELQKDS